MKSNKDVLKKRMSVVGNDFIAATTLSAQEVLPEENVDFDLPVVIFPEWNDADIAAEKWATKGQFEDNDTIIYPRSLRGKFDHYKKPMELVSEGQSPVIMQATIIQDEIFHGHSSLKGETVGFFSNTHGLAFAATPNEPIYENQLSEASVNDFEKSDLNIVAQASLMPESNSSQANVSEKDKSPSMAEIDIHEHSDSLGKTSKLFQANKHLLNSRLMTHILSIFHFIYDQGKITKQYPGEDYFLWDCIYPKGKDGLPMYNPSGKYVVKLFWLGSWRKITVDDRIPCSSDGKPIVVSSPIISEIWPVLITKAILKIAVYSYREISEFPEQGDFDVLYALRGLLPEKLHIASDSSKLWNHLKNLSVKLNQPTINVSRSNSPSRERQASLFAKGSIPTTKTESPAMIFSYRDPQNSDNEFGDTDMKTMGFYFRICEFKELDQSNEEEMEPSKYLRLRSYFSCGTNKKRMLSPTSHKKSIIPEVDNACHTIDTWITFDEFVYLFSDVVVYHPTSNFKNIKTYQCINDPAKPSDNYRIPPLISSLEDSKECEVLINISTFGRANYQTSTLTVEPYSWTNSENQIPIIQTSTNSVGTILLKILNRELAYRFIVDCSTSYYITFFAKDDFGLDDEAKYLQEAYGITVKDYEDSYTPQPPGSWSIVFKQILYFSDPTYLSANLFLPDFIQTYGSLKMIDNDDYSVIPNAFFNLRRRNYTPNKNGYTLIAELKTPLTRMQGKFKVRLISDTPIVNNPERPPEVWTKGIVQDFEEAYITNKHNIIFRYLLKIKDGILNPASLQVNFSIQSLPIKLELYDNDVQIFCAYGRGIVNIPLYIFYPSEDPNIKTSDRTKDDRNNSMRDKNSTSQGSARSSLPKHKYILQASIDKPPFFSTSNSTISSSEAGTRPLSRGGLKVGVPMDKSSPSKRTRKPTMPSPDEKAASTTAIIDTPWKLRIISTDTVSMTVVKDTEKEDRYRAIKESWESAQPGRSARAYDIRDAYLKSVDNNSIQPIFMTPNPGSDLKYKPWKRQLRPTTADSETSLVEDSQIPFLDEDSWSKMQSEREARLKVSLAEISRIKSERKREKDARISDNKLKDLLSALSSEAEALCTLDLGKRTEYIARVLAENEEVAKAIEAAKNAELLAAGAAEEPDKKKKGKK